MCKLFEGKWVVVSGLFINFDRHHLKNELCARGATVSARLDRRVAMLIAGDAAGRKVAEAEHLGIRIVYENELLTLLGRGNDDQADKAMDHYSLAP